LGALQGHEGIQPGTCTEKGRANQGGLSSRAWRHWRIQGSTKGSMMEKMIGVWLLAVAEMVAVIMFLTYFKR